MFGKQVFLSNNKVYTNENKEYTTHETFISLQYNIHSDAFYKQLIWVSMQLEKI